MDTDFLSLDDLPAELDLPDPTSSHHGDEGGGHDGHVTCSDSARGGLGEWCEGCQALRQELDKTHSDHTVNYNMLKEKIVQTDLLIKRYNAKCQESESNCSKMEAASRQRDKAARECETMASNLKSTLEEGEPLRKAKERLEKQKEQQQKQSADLEFKLKALQITHNQVQVRLQEQVDKFDKLDAEHHNCRAKIRELEASLKRTEANLQRAQDDVSGKRQNLKLQQKLQQKKQKLHNSLEKKVAHYEGILIKHGLSSAITSRPGRQSCDSSVVSLDIGRSEDSDQSETESVADDALLDRVFREMGVFECLRPILPALSPIPASPAPSQHKVCSSDSDLSDDDDAVSDSSGDLDDVADLLQDQLLDSPDRLGAATTSSGQPSASPGQLSASSSSPAPVKAKSLVQRTRKTLEKRRSPRRSPRVSRVGRPKVFQRQMSMDEGEDLDPVVDQPVVEQLEDDIEEEVLTSLPFTPSEGAVLENQNTDSQEMDTGASLVSKDNDNHGLSVSGSDSTSEAPSNHPTSEQSSHVTDSKRPAGTKPLPAALAALSARGRLSRRKLRHAPVDLDTELLERKAATPRMMTFCPKRNNNNNGSATVESKDQNDNVSDKLDHVKSPENDSSMEKLTKSPKRVTRSMSHTPPRSASPRSASSEQQRTVSPRTRSNSTPKAATERGACQLRRSPRIRHQSETVPQEVTNHTLTNSVKVESKGDSANQEVESIDMEETKLEAANTILESDDEQSMRSLDNHSRQERVEENEKMEEGSKSANCDISDSEKENIDMKTTMEEQLAKSDTQVVGETEQSKSAKLSDSSSQPIMGTANIIENTCDNDKSKNVFMANISTTHSLESAAPYLENAAPDTENTAPDMENTAPDMENTAPDMEKPVLDMEKPAEKASEESTVLEDDVSSPRAPPPGPLPKQASTGFDVLGTEDDEMHECQDDDMTLPVCTGQMSPLHDDTAAESSDHTHTLKTSLKSPVAKRPQSLASPLRLKSPVRFLVGYPITSESEDSENEEEIVVPVLNKVPPSKKEVRSSPKTVENSAEFDYVPAEKFQSTANSAFRPFQPSSKEVHQPSKNVIPSVEVSCIEEDPDIDFTTIESSSKCVLPSPDYFAPSPSLGFVDDSLSVYSPAPSLMLVADLPSPISPLSDFTEMEDYTDMVTAEEISSVAMEETLEAQGDVGLSKLEVTKTVGASESSDKVNKSTNEVIEMNSLASGDNVVSGTSHKEPVLNTKEPQRQKPKEPCSKVKPTLPKTQNKNSTTVGSHEPVLPNVNSDTQNLNEMPKTTTDAQANDPLASKRQKRLKSKNLNLWANIAMSQTDDKHVEKVFVNSEKKVAKETVPKDTVVTATTGEPTNRKARKRKSEGLSESESRPKENKQELKPIPQMSAKALKQAKKAVGQQLQFLLQFPSTPLCDVINKLSSAGVRPQGLVDGVVQHLLQHSSDVVSSWVTRCQGDNVTDGDNQSAPWLNKQELAFIELLTAYSNTQGENEPAVQSVLYDTVKATLRKPFTPGVPVSGYLALGRIFIGMCRSRGDLARARVFLFDLVQAQLNMFAAQVVMVAGVWPEVCARQDSPVVTVLEYIVLTRALNPTKMRHSNMAFILCRRCGWLKSDQSADSIVAGLFSGLKAAVADGNHLARVSSYERAIDLLSVHEGWQFANNVIVVRHLWPALQTWRPGAGGQTEAIAESVLRVLGLVMSHTPAQGRVTARGMLSPLVSVLQDPNVSPGIQLAAVSSLIRLCAYDPPQATNCLQAWLRKPITATEIHREATETFRSIAQQCVKHFTEKEHPS